MNETQFTKKVRDYISEHKGGSVKLGASQFLAKGTPDMICCLDGYTFLLEDKVWPNVTSKIQKAVIAKMRSEGFFVWVLTQKDDIFLLDDKEHCSLDSVFEYIISAMKGALRSAKT